MIFGAPDVKKMKYETDIGGLIKALGYKKDATVRREAAEALGSVGTYPDREKTVKTLARALNDNDSSVRQAAAQALAEIWPGGAAEFVIPALNDKDRGVRTTAARVLGKIGDRRAIEPLSNVLTNPDLYSDEAAIALGSFGDRRAVEPLIRLLEAHEASVGSLRETATKLLGDIGDPRAVEPLIRVVTADYSKYFGGKWFPQGVVDLTCNAVESLSKIGDHRAVAPISKALLLPGAKTRESARRALFETFKKYAAESIADILREQPDLNYYWFHLPYSQSGPGPVTGGRARHGGQIANEVKDFKRGVCSLGAPMVPQLIELLSKMPGDKSPGLVVELLGYLHDHRAVGPLQEKFRELKESGGNKDFRDAILKALGEIAYPDPRTRWELEG